jgi:RNA polymerase sigma-70 factor, ECF subfamily
MTLFAVGPAEVSDGELVVRAQGGDANALSTLLARHFDYVNALCRRMLRNAADAEDARQEALMQAARTIATFDHRAAFRTWLHTVTRNVCLNAIRRAAKTGVPVDDSYLNETAAPRLEVAATVAERIDVHSALAAVNPAFRDVLVLRYICDLEYAEIAEALGIPVNTVRTQLFRGKAQLLTLLGGPEGTTGADVREVG